MRARVSIVLLLLSAVLGSAATVKSDPSTEEIEKIIKTFAANEASFAKAREVYTYRQTARILEVDDLGVPGGKWEMVSDIVFEANGRRTERVVKAPLATLQRISLSPEDEQDLRNVLPFVLTSNEIDNYFVRYLGRQNADEVPCFVFAVKPKKMEPGRRYFMGQIWVDDRDLMIVKTYGRSAGIIKKGTDQAFPKFETYREQIDGKYWFPTYTVANSLLHFNQTGDVRIKLTVKYEDYKRFKAESAITFGDEVTAPTPAPTPAPSK
ncbi:MAG TPA: hypothetical protein VER03_22080 [Bryobacteraceae bacterium]|nr:hypothetical protein [Bryobacteraceae bacterium]